MRGVFKEIFWNAPKAKFFRIETLLYESKQFVKRDSFFRGSKIYQNRLKLRYEGATKSAGLRRWG